MSPALSVCLVAGSCYCCCRRRCLKRSAEQDSYSASIVGMELQSYYSNRAGGVKDLLPGITSSSDQQSLIQPKSILKQGESSRFSHRLPSNTQRSIAESSHSSAAISQVLFSLSLSLSHNVSSRRLSIPTTRPSTQTFSIFPTETWTHPPPPPPSPPSSRPAAPPTRHSHTRTR